MASEISGVIGSPPGVMGHAVLRISGEIESVAIPRARQMDEARPRANLVLDRYAQAQEMREGLTQAALAVRDSYRTLNIVEQLLDEMKADLTAIAKQYPPYPIDNPERIELLNRVTALRKQIDALTIPPPDSRRPALLADPARYEQAGDLLLVIREGETERVRAQPAHAGPGGLDLPEMDPTKAEDAEIAAALERVEAAQSQIEQKKTGMWEDVVRIANKIDEEAARLYAQASALAASRQEFQAIGAERSVLAQV